jgi:FMN-dependent NADH-azoreductase
MHQGKPRTLLRIDSSARVEGSVSRDIGDRLQQRWLAANPGGRVMRRDLAAEPLPQIDAAWVSAGFTERESRNDAQHACLAQSEALIDELRAADALLLTVPLYNFGIPAGLKAWIDLVCRARETFAYGADGPKGLLADRPVYLVMASGGVPLGSAMDFASGYLEHVLGFIGLNDVRMIAADRLNLDGDAALARAAAQLDAAFHDEAAA